MFLCYRKKFVILVNEVKPEGSYEVQFNGSELTSGIYFYQLLVSALQSKDGKAGEYSETKKMILRKLESSKQSGIQKLTLRYVTELC